MSAVLVSAAKPFQVWLPSAICRFKAVTLITLLGKVLLSSKGKLSVLHPLACLLERVLLLKIVRTEYRLIVDIVSRLALANPNIHFFLSHNGRTVFDIPKNASLPSRIETLLGSSVLLHLLPIHSEDSYVKLSGFISKPQLSPVII